MGDFNLPSIKWYLECYRIGLSRVDSSFLDCFTSLGLSQLIMEPTFFPSGNILDLILISDIDRIGDTQVFPPFPNCGHSPVIASYYFQATNPPADCTPLKLWRRGQYTEINNALAEIDWEFELAHLDPDQMYTRFLNIIQPLTDRYIPTKDNPNPSQLPWPIKPPPALKRLRSNLWSEYKLLRRLHGRTSPLASEKLNQFLETNHQYRNYAIIKQSQYESSIADQLTTNPKVFHAYIRRKKVNPPNIGPLKSPTGEIITDPKEMAELFADSFVSVYTTINPVSPSPHQMFDGLIPELNITINDVITAIKLLDSNSSMGPDGLHPLLLKSCMNMLAYPLFLIFRASYATGRLPSIWKKSSVIPIFKKGSRYDPLKYRPISLTSIAVKSMERIITKFVYEYAEDNNILNNDQFGFRSGRSTEDQLILTYNDISLWLDQGYNADLILFDFSKVFDVVCHDLLIVKLSSLGIRGNLLNWIVDFLHDRKMSVSVNHQHSSTRPVASGVPQGSVLGPLLFLLYVNFLTHDITSPTKIFADDLKLYVNIRLDSDLTVTNDIASCQSDIDKLAYVSNSWGLHMNPDKCVLLRFVRKKILWDAINHSREYYLNGSPIPTKDSATDLGVLVDTSLKFHQHITNTVNKAGGLATSILRSTVNREASFMIPLYVSHIRPILEYASSLWNTGYSMDLHLLESVQRRWTKTIQGLENLSYYDRLKVLNLF